MKRKLKTLRKLFTFHVWLCFTWLVIQTQMHDHIIMSPENRGGRGLINGGHGTGNGLFPQRAHGAGRTFSKFIIHSQHASVEGSGLCLYEHSVYFLTAVFSESFPSDPRIPVYALPPNKNKTRQKLKQLAANWRKEIGSAKCAQESFSYR